MSENGITTIENLNENKLLETLDLAKNQITKIENVNHLTEMEDLWLNDNKLTDWNCITNLTNNKKLTTVYLERNPIAADLQYRSKLKLTLPWLEKIDATLCR